VSVKTSKSSERRRSRSGSIVNKALARVCEGGGGKEKKEEKRKRGILAGMRITACWSV